MAKISFTNAEISTHFRDYEAIFSKRDFMSAFAYWVVSLSPYDVPELEAPLRAWNKFLDARFGDNYYLELGYKALSEICSSSVFMAIPEIAALNSRRNSRQGRSVVTRSSRTSPDDDFIDLEALARNIFFLMLRRSFEERDVCSTIQKAEDLQDG